MATETMLAVVKTRPERGVDITRVDIPHCRPHEVLVRLRATSVWCGVRLSGSARAVRHPTPPGQYC